ncbi:MAG TPA: hypothetical protein VGN25_09930 [Solirubrobacteraceae bacterium]|jgi:hypothetical protein|nr:hypothetical protein [Solirubrobacteraceae bacterium]
MSSPILPTLGPLGPPTQSLDAPGARDELSLLVAGLGAEEGSLSVEALHGGPPPEVLEQMTAADDVLLGLRERGLAVCFSGAEEPVTIELRDSEADTVRALSATEAIAVAAGTPVEQG